MMHLTLLKMFLQALQTEYSLEVLHSGAGYSYSTTKYNNTPFVEVVLEDFDNTKNAEDVLTHMFCMMQLQAKFGVVPSTGTVYLDRQYSEERIHRVALRVSGAMIKLQYGWMCWGGDDGIFHCPTTFDMDASCGLGEFLETYLDHFAQIL